MKQRIDDLSEKEQAWVEAQFDGAVRFVEAFSPQDVGKPLTLASLDRAFAAWVEADPNAEVALVNNIVNWVGVAFGRFLVDGTGLKWVIATDEDGPELAIYGLPGAGDVLVYPVNFVAKRWERRETHFIQRSYQKIAEQVRSINRQSN